MEKSYRMVVFFEKIKILPSRVMEINTLESWKRKDIFSVIGMMSGTSLDGIDLAYITFKKASKWTFEVQHAQTYPYPEDWLSKLEGLTQYSHARLKSIDTAYTAYLAEVVRDFMDTYSITTADALCSHGHTAWHQPDKGFTCQIGNQPALATLLGLPVICDFRTQDVALQGQGAPLVPVGDQLLFSDYDACLNLGGFANITRQDHDRCIAFDVGGFNLVFNRLAQVLGQSYDDSGKIAASGSFLPQLFHQLQALDYYQKPAPKSLGLEWLEQEVYPLLDQALLGATVEDVLHTYAQHISCQLLLVLNGHEKILCTGGGVYNSYLMGLLQKELSSAIIIPSEECIDYKEAIVFGFLGVLRMLGINNCFASITGATKDHCSGVVYFP